MCVSNNFVEQQAYGMSEKICKNSLYKIIRLDYSGGGSLGFQKQNQQWVGDKEITGNDTVLITKVVLEDKDGTLYSIEPNLNGLRFSQGEITYNQYKSLQKRETFNVFAGLLLIFAFFSGVMYILMRFLV